MRVKIHSTDDLKELFLGTLLNNTDKVSKVSKHSTLSGVGYGVAKIGNKVLKEVALLESRIFPSFARGTDLDFAGGEIGVSPRFSASGSSTSLRVVADTNTTYTASVNTFSGTHGVIFEMTTDSVTVDSNGFAFIPVRSQTTGSDTNVSANSITKVTSAPIGHKSVTNDFIPMGGRDIEDDMSFRARIKDSGLS